MPSHRKLPRNEEELVKALRAIEMAQARVLAHEALAKREANVKWLKNDKGGAA